MLQTRPFSRQPCWQGPFRQSVDPVSWFKYPAHYEALQRTDNDPFIRNSCAGAGRHLKHAGHFSLFFIFLHLLPQMCTYKHATSRPAFIWQTDYLLLFVCYSADLVVTSDTVVPRTVLILSFLCMWGEVMVVPRCLTFHSGSSVVYLSWNTISIGGVATPPAMALLYMFCLGKEGRRVFDQADAPIHLLK